MSDDTRDIAIRTQTEVAGLSTKVDKLTDMLESIRDEMTERKGAEKVAKWVIGLGSGTAGGLIAKFGTALMGMPLPK